MSTLDFIMRQPVVYRLWMATHAERKFAPIAARNDMSRIRRVLDVGCGPGTNADYFSRVAYLGIDLNEQYIRDAERRHGDSPAGRRFLAVDAAKFVAPPGERFDFVLVNSFLHHVDDSTAKGILSNLSKLLTEDGHVHILDLVLPETASLARFMARSDRGEFPRPLGKWRKIFSDYFEPVNFEPYDLGFLGIAFWKMVYFKGKART
ncbi:MAG TPA: class I SAM-dependent methyltransferase, partial [Candidatus Acidoferrum sp.]|nr:class I SAM-dependent methyltransferase [Candidatus Acidoferrum sp.]